MPRIATKPPPDAPSYELFFLLLEAPAGDKQPLFRSGADLGRRLAALPDSPYPNAATATSYVNLVLRGKRNCSENLRLALAAAVAERLSGEPPAEQEKWLWRVESVIGVFNSTRQRSSTPTSLEERKLRELGAHARRVLVVAPLMAPVLRSVAGEHHLYLLLRRLGAIPGQEVQQQSAYVFYVLDAQEALAFWHALLQVAALLLSDPTAYAALPAQPPPAAPQRHGASASPPVRKRKSAPQMPEAGAGRLTAEGLEQAAAYLAGLEQEEESRLQVYTLPYYLCLEPISLFTTQTDEVVGYVMFYEASSEYAYRYHAVPESLMGLWRRFRDDVEGGKFERVRVGFTENQTSLVHSIRQTLPTEP